MFYKLFLLMCLVFVSAMCQSVPNGGYSGSGGYNNNINNNNNNGGSGGYSSGYTFTSSSSNDGGNEGEIGNGIVDQALLDQISQIIYSQESNQINSQSTSSAYGVPAVLENPGYSNVPSTQNQNQNQNQAQAQSQTQPQVNSFSAAPSNQFVVPGEPSNNVLPSLTNQEQYQAPATPFPPSSGISNGYQAPTQTQSSSQNQQVTYGVPIGVNSNSGGYNNGPSANSQSSGGYNNGPSSNSQSSGGYNNNNNNQNINNNNNNNNNNRPSGGYTNGKNSGGLRSGSSSSSRRPSAPLFTASATLSFGSFRPPARRPSPPSGRPQATRAQQPPTASSYTAPPIPAPAPVASQQAQASGYSSFGFNAPPPSNTFTVPSTNQGGNQQVSQPASSYNSPVAQASNSYAVPSQEGYNNNKNNNNGNQNGYTNSASSFSSPSSTPSNTFQVPNIPAPGSVYGVPTIANFQQYAAASTTNNINNNNNSNNNVGDSPVVIEGVQRARLVANFQQQTQTNAANSGGYTSGQNLGGY